MQKHHLLRCAVFIALFSVLTTFVAAQRGRGPASPRSAQDVLSEIKKKGDHSPDHLFTLLGQMRDEAGLAALQKATGEVRRVYKVRAVYRAFAHFQGAGELESKAITWLVNRANRGQVAGQRAAAGGLTHMGEPAHDELATLLRTHKDGILRATVLAPLLPGMGANPKAADLPLIVDNYQVPRTGDRKTAVEVLRAYSDKASLRVFEARLVDKRFPRLMKTAIIEAVAPLPGAPVDRLLDLGLDAKDPAVQFAALQALQGREGSPNARKLQKLTKSPDAAVRRLALVALAQGSIGDPDFQQDLLKWARNKDSAVRQGAAVGLALWRGPEAVEGLHILLADPEYAVRAEALQQVGNLHRKASIPALITRLGAEQGRLSVDVASVLRLMTGLDYGRTPARWRAWWASEGEAFQLPSYEEALRTERQRNRRAGEGRTTTSFYGLQIVSDRVCFVLDISGSMQGANLTAAKRELSAALDKYPEGDLFNIVFYSSDVFPWQDELLEMNKRNRKASLAYVERQNAGGGTAIFDALEAAFEDSLIDTIFLLSDGNPTAGRITDPGQIRAEVKRWNSARKVRINCISLGMDSPLLRNLASDSGGQYTQVR